MNPAERPTTRRPKRGGTDAWTPEKVARLVPTKLPPTLLRAYVIPQQRLLDKLREAPYSHRLTLVFGPAGYEDHAFGHVAPRRRYAWMKWESAEATMRFDRALEGWSYRRRPSPSLGGAAGRAAPPGRLE